MTKEYLPDALDIRAFAKSAAELEALDGLDAYPRITQDAREVSAADMAGQGEVRWSVRGRTVSKTAGPDEIWLDLDVQAAVPQVCQRCMQPMLSQVATSRSFRFVEDERTAAQLDEESEEDILVISRRFDLRALIEDEILMDLPLVPRHEECPQTITWVPEGDGFEDAGQQEEQRRNPFAALDVLKKKL